LWVFLNRNRTREGYGETKGVCANSDTIVRLPFGEDKTFIPVSVVSKEYALVPHADVLDVATRALEASKIPSSLMAH
jgi:hypothetical protein